jgi:predicted AlkP superfamily pyrophosphatase or phosphodiesterase
MGKRSALLLVIFLSFLSVLCSAETPAGKPSLIILISVDQMRADYLDRFGAEFTGGFKRLTSEGRVCADADLNYAQSLTGPGHATLSTGSYPRTHCIVSNDWVDHTTQQDVYCVDDPQAKTVGGEGGGMSPRNLVVTGLGDWIKAVSKQSRVISVGGKDRSVILMGGKQPDAAFWYSNANGHMVTSDYYGKELPAWAQQFNKENWIGKHLPSAWAKLKPEKAYAKDEPDGFAAEWLWENSASFPHPFSADKKNKQLQDSPYWDMLILDFANVAVKSEKLGQRGVPDLLCLALSATDYIGHSFGPNSHEIHDHLLRLDLALGSFLSDMEKDVGKGRVMVALTADHGVLPLPEYQAQFQHGGSRRINPEKTITPRIRALDEQLRREWKINDWLIHTADDEGNFLNYETARKAGVTPSALQSRVRSGFLSIDGVKAVYFRDDLAAKSPDARPYLTQFRNGYCAQRAGDFEVLFCDGCLLDDGTTGTTHGSPYPYDTHVAMLFWGAGIHEGRVDREVHTVDVAPTIARLLGIPYPKSVDGIPLSELTK